MQNEPDKLFNRNYVIQWQGQTVSRLGSQIFMAGLLFWVKHATGSAALMGGLSMVSSLPGVILMPVGGALADRYPRRSIIIIGDLVRGLALLALTALMVLRPAAVPAIVVGLFLVSVINGIVGSFFGPALAATIPDIVPKDKVVAANSLGQLSLQGSLFVGQAIGGWLYQLVGATVLFFVNSLSFLYASASEVFVKIPQTIPERQGNWREQFRTFGQEIAEGFRYVWAKPGLRGMLLFSAALAFFTSPIIVLMPFYVEDTLRATPAWYGFLLSGYAVGTMLGYVLAGILRIPPGARGALMMVISVLVPLGFIGLALAPSTAAALLLTVLGGLAAGYVTVNITTLIQATTPSEIRGRVVGLLAALSTALTPIGAGVAGIAADLVDQNIPLIFIICGVATAAIALLLTTSRSYRAIMSTDFRSVAPQRGPAQPPKPQLPGAQ
ncbi:MAG: MFS transporter [Anaerolineae bacterium]|jgi:MFS family permease|nr:MFS transporter [Anaerolineae bacterium]